MFLIKKEVIMQPDLVKTDEDLQALINEGGDTDKI